MKPPFAYFGGKTTLAERIVALLPEHTHYVEPFAGSLAVLLAKPRSPMETVNDIDGQLMTFWRVLRERHDELLMSCALTPHCRAEHEASYEDLTGCDDLEVARRVWVRLTQGRGGTMRRTGWRFFEDPSRRKSTGMPDYLAGYLGRFGPAAARIAGVSLESRDALEIVERYGEHRDVLIYADPPYLGSTRTASQYAHEMASSDAHRDLAKRLNECKAAVVLSGYASDLYEDIYDGWHRAELAAFTGQAKTCVRRVEVLWSNRPIGSQMELSA